MSNAITRLNPTSMPDAGAVGYSQISIVESGKLAFVSGQVAWTSSGEPAPSGLAEQAKLVLENAGAALRELNVSTHDIAMVRVFMIDLSPERLDVLMPLLNEWFDGAKPSLTGVGVAALAAPDLQLEMEMTVRLPS